MAIGRQRYRAGRITVGVGHRQHAVIGADQTDGHDIAIDVGCTESAADGAVTRLGGGIDRQRRVVIDRLGLVKGNCVGRGRRRRRGRGGGNRSGITRNATDGCGGADRLAERRGLWLEAIVGLRQIRQLLDIQRRGAGGRNTDSAGIVADQSRGGTQFGRRHGAAMGAFDRHVERNVDAAGDAAQRLHLGRAGRALLHVGEVAQRGVRDIGRPGDVEARIAQALILDIVQHRQIIESLLRIPRTGTLIVVRGSVDVVGHGCLPGKNIARPRRGSGRFDTFNRDLEFLQAKTLSSPPPSMTAVTGPLHPWHGSNVENAVAAPPPDTIC